VRISPTSPSIVPHGQDRTIYLVMDVDGDHVIFHKSRIDETDFATVLENLIGGQWQYPLRVIALNPEREWSMDVSVHFAYQIKRRFDRCENVPSHLKDFVSVHLRPYGQIVKIQSEVFDGGE
jgi:hypothetical protein